MLNHIPKCLPPELVKLMMEMGHGDELVLGDGNFPATSHAQRLIRADGHNIPALLDAILPLFPLDYAVDFTAILMDSRNQEPAVWKIYKEKLGAYPDGDKQFSVISKPEFYERAKKAYCIVATGESERFANLIIRKGIIN